MSKEFKLDPDVADELKHYGVKGMKWGVRKDRGSRRPEGVSRSANRAAKKDAKEFATAKVYDGKGAGSRRRSIKAKVNERSASEEYKKAFDFHLKNQDTFKRVKQAKRDSRLADALNAATDVVDDYNAAVRFRNSEFGRFVEAATEIKYNQMVNSSAYRNGRRRF